MVESKQRGSQVERETENYFWLDPDGIFLLWENAGFSTKKRWVLGFLIQGMTYGEMAEHLGMSVGVVENTVSHSGVHGTPGILQDLRRVVDEEVYVNRRSLLWALACISWLRIDRQKLASAASEIVNDPHVTVERLKAVELGLKGFSAAEIARKISFGTRSVYRYHSKIPGGVDDLVTTFAWYMAQDGGLPPGFEAVVLGEVRLEEWGGVGRMGGYDA